MLRFENIKNQNPNLFNNNNNNNKNFIIIVILVAIGSFSLGYDCYELINKKSEQQLLQKQQEIQYELIQNNKVKHKIKDIEPKGKTQELIDFQDMDKKFYTHLENCESLNIKTKNGYIEYIIEGKVEDKCLFKHRQIGFMDTICSIPMDVAKKYSEEGLNIERQLEELKSQNKSGFVDGSQYINDINNNKAYCRHEYYQRKK